MHLERPAIMPSCYNNMRLYGKFPRAVHRAAAPGHGGGEENEGQNQEALEEGTSANEVGPAGHRHMLAAAAERVAPAAQPPRHPQQCKAREQQRAIVPVRRRCARGRLPAVTGKSRSARACTRRLRCFSGAHRPQVPRRTRRGIVDGSAGGDESLRG